ncbi:MAG: transposase [Anaerolineales bacterium]|nr:transposase [Anaerolineales bacterium]
MKYDPKIHHRRSIRLKGYDYTQAGAYFVTICTYQRENIFGEIINGEMKLSKFGLVASQQWEKLIKRFPNIELGAFVIMPNHSHGIIQIVEREVQRRDTASRFNDQNDESSRRVPTERFQKPVAGSIPTIIRSYKSAVAYRINLMRNNKDTSVWQRNYYEHVIRNEKELELITKYIEYNPMNWQLDHDNVENNLPVFASVEDYIKDAEAMIGLKK